MSNWIIEKDDFYKGRRYVIALNTTMGYRYGYVEIKEGEPYYNIDYDDYMHNINSVGLTFSGRLASIGNAFFIGWDHAHIYDGADIDAIRKYNKDKSPKELRMMIESVSYTSGPISYLKDVENECFETIDELLQKGVISL